MVMVKIGNIFESGASTIVNTVNCVGVMGKGIALDFKKRYPNMYAEYATMCERHEVHAGIPYYYNDLLGNSIINFPTKDHWRSPSKLSYIISGLDWFVKNYKELGITSIAFPPLGCGNGGLSWNLVGPIMYGKLSDLPINIIIYAPFGTNKELLNANFLAKKGIESNKDILGSEHLAFNDKWNLILYVVQILGRQKYSLRVGRVIFQKICYALTREGIDTGFVFTRGEYGPYSADIKRAIMVLSNANLIYEKQLGSMIYTEVSPDFKLKEEMFSRDEMKCVEKTVNLFSRIKNTAQAEMIATVLFATDKVSDKAKLIYQRDIYDYVLSWKPQWATNKQAEVMNTIENLQILDWISVLESKDLSGLFCEDI